MKHQKGRIRTNWLLVSVSALLFICLLFFAFSFRVYRSFEKNEKESMSRAASTMKTVLDESFANLVSQSISLLNSSTAVDLTDAKDLAELKDKGGYELFMDIRNAMRFDSLLKDVLIYYPKSGYVVGNNGVKTLENYCKTHLASSPRADAAEWKKIMEEGQNGFFAFTGDEVEGYYRITSIGSEKRILIVKLNSENLSSGLAWLASGNDQYFVGVVNEENIVMAGTGMVDSFVDASFKLATPESKDWLVTVSDSSMDSLRYVIALRKTEAYRLSTLYFRLSVLIIVLTALAGGFLVVWNYRRSVQPLEMIASRLNRGADSTGNEIRLINEAIEDLLNELDCAYAQIAEQEQEKTLREEPGEPEEEIAAGDSGNEIASKVYQYIEENYFDSQLDLCLLAEKLNYSRTYISRLFKADYGTGIAEYINLVRISKAKEIMEESSLSIKEIALKVGFAGDVQFIRAFKRQEGITPGVYRSNLYS